MAGGYDEGSALVLIVLLKIPGAWKCRERIFDLQNWWLGGPGNTVPASRKDHFAVIAWWRRRKGKNCREEQVKHTGSLALS